MVKKIKKQTQNKESKLPVLAKIISIALILISLGFIILSKLFFLDYISLQESSSLVFGSLLLVPSLAIFVLNILFLMRYNWARITLNSLLSLSCIYLLSITIGSLRYAEYSYAFESLIILLILGFIVYYFGSNKKVKEAFKN